MTMTLVPTPTVIGTENAPLAGTVTLYELDVPPASTPTTPMSTVSPAVAVPVTVSVLPGVGDWSAGAVTVRLVVEVAWVTYRSRTTPGCSRLRPAPRSAVSRTSEAAPQVSGAAEPAAWPSVKPIDAVVGSLP